MVHGGRRLHGERIPPPLHGSPALKKIIFKICEFDVKNRCTDVYELQHAFEELLYGKTADAMRQNDRAVIRELDGQPPLTDDSGTVRDFSEQTDGTGHNPKPKWRIAAVSALAVLAVIIAAFAVGDSPEDYDSSKASTRATLSEEEQRCTERNCLEGLFL